MIYQLNHRNAKDTKEIALANPEDDGNLVAHAGLHIAVTIRVTQHHIHSLQNHFHLLLKENLLRRNLLSILVNDHFMIGITLQALYIFNSFILHLGV